MVDKISIQLYGALVDTTNTSRIELHHVADTDTLKHQLIQKYPLLATKEFAIAIDQKIIHTNTAIHPESEIALLPPFSGG
jgi:molybdopterin converting factor small subunit